VGRIFTLTNSNTNELGRQKKTIGREIVIGPTAIKFITVIIFAILALVYLNQSTAGANRSVKIRNLEERKGDLMLEKERLEVEQTRLRSLGQIDQAFTPEKSEEEKKLEPVSSVIHLNTNEYALANNR